MKCLSSLRFPNADFTFSWKSFHWRQSFSDILFGEFERLTVEREFSLLLFLYSEHCRQFLDAIAPFINQSLLLDRWLTQCKVTVSPGCIISTCSNVHLPEGRQPAVKKAEAGSPLTPPVKTLLLYWFILPVAVKVDEFHALLPNWNTEMGALKYKLELFGI